MPQTERRLTKRQLLTGAGTGLVTLGLVGLGFEIRGASTPSNENPANPSDNGNGHNNGSSPERNVPSMTEAPTLIPTTDYEHLAASNFDQIDRAEEGQEIKMANFVVHGFQRITASIPGTNITATEDAALSARIAKDGKSTVFSGVVLGAGCLLELAEQQGLLKGVVPYESEEGNSKYEIWTLKTPMIVPEIRVRADKDIAGFEGGKMLDMEGYRSDKSDLENLCVRRTNILGYNAIKEGYLLSREVRQKLDGK
jgi:hypothetical protein